MDYAYTLVAWTTRHRPKPRFYRLDTLCGRAPKFRRFCWRKNLGKGEPHGPKSVKPSPPCISLLWDDASKPIGNWPNTIAIATLRRDSYALGGRERTQT